MKNRRQIFFLFAIVISNNTNGQNWKLLTDSARIYQQKGEVHIAINYFERAEMLLKRDSSETAIYAQIQFAVGNLYADLGEFTKAVIYVQASKEIMERILGNGHPDYAKSCNILGSLYIELGEYKKAELMLFMARSVYERISGKMNKSYAATCNNIGMLFRIQGLYDKAEPYYREAKDVFENTNGKESSAYANCCNSLGLLYLDKEQYDKSEQFFLECKIIREKILGKEHLYYGDICNNLALLYNNLGQYKKAEQLYTVTREVYKKVLGDQHADYALSINNLADLLSNLGEFGKAETLYLEAKQIREKVLGKNHPEYAKSCNNLAVLYLRTGQLEKSKYLFTEAKKIREESLGNENIEYAESCNNLGSFYKEIGQYPDAEKLYLEAKNIREKVLGKASSVYVASCSNIADLYRVLNNLSEASGFYKEAFYNQQNILKKLFLFTSESEQQSYIRNIKKISESILSFYSASGLNIPTSFVLDISFANRNLILNSSRNLRNAIIDIRDSVIRYRYNDWIDTREQLAFWLSKSVQDRGKMGIELEEKANNMEKELNRTSADFRRLQKKQEITWKDLQQSLKTNEAAIEFAEFQYYNGKSWTDSTYYIAMVLRKEHPEPVLVNLFEKRQLDSLLSYKSTSAGQVQLSYLYKKQPDEKNNSLYDIIWKPIEQHLMGIKTVYFAPAGSLYKIAFAAMPVNQEEVLSDKYQLIQLNSTASSGDKSVTPLTISDKIILYGGIQYDADSITIKKAALHYSTNDVAARYLPEGLSRDGMNDFYYLSGTKNEISAINKLAGQNYFVTTISDGMMATEESFKALNGKNSPAVLHIATHGFFFPDPKYIKKNDRLGGAAVFKQSDNPLMRSGLAFAGANNAWKGKAVEGVEDGILTSYEVSNMYLPNTKLAVLSACETGLGDIQGSEGVYGLQRAFKMAGVQNLVMSLWKVSDAESSEFMQEFYKNLFAKQTIGTAFYNAQTVLKNRYRNDPYKWAAWVLVR